MHHRCSSNFWSFAGKIRCSKKQRQRIIVLHRSNRLFYSFRSPVEVERLWMFFIKLLIGQSSLVDVRWAISYREERRVQLTRDRSDVLPTVRLLPMERKISWLIFPLKIISLLGAQTENEHYRRNFLIEKQEFVSRTDWSIESSRVFTW